MEVGYIHTIETLSLIDGPGVRTVIFLSGCPRHCLYCHNPEMLNITSGRQYNTQDVLNIIKKYKNYYQNNGGVTFSGGEPLLQPNFIKEITKLTRNNNIHTTIETAGFEVSDDVLANIDLIILDIKAISNDMALKLTKIPLCIQQKFINQCIRLNKKIIIRHVIIPGINDTREYILMFKDFISYIPNIVQVELLPYHNMALSKYQKLKLNYQLMNVPAMDKEKCKQLNSLL